MAQSMGLDKQEPEWPWKELLALASAPGSGPASAAAVGQILSSCSAPEQRRGFIVSPLDTVAPPKPLLWIEGRRQSGDIKSLSLLDLASFVDQPEVVEVCLGKVEAKTWGAVALGSCMSLCIERGAWKSVESLVGHPEVPTLVLSTGKSFDFITRGLLSVDFLGSQKGRLVLSALKASAGEQVFNKWVHERTMERWQAVLVSRSLCGGPAERLLLPWSKQAMAMSMFMGSQGQDLWSYAIDSVKVMAAFARGGGGRRRRLVADRASRLARHRFVIEASICVGA
jgi:hypothetical protein